MNVATENQTPDIDLKNEIDRLASFLNIRIPDSDEMNSTEKLMLLKQLVAVSQMKLTRMALSL